MPNSLNFKRDHYCAEDQLGRDKYIKTLAGMIEEKNFNTPFCIGIFGKWGSGKTSFMRQLERELEQNLEKNPQKPYPVTVWFNPWRYEKEEHLIVPFLKTIEKELRAKSKDRKYPDNGEVKSLLQKAADKASIAARAVAYGAKVKFFGMADFSGKDMIEQEKKLTAEQKAELTKLAESLPSIYYDITKHLKETVKQEEFRLVVFIDDLDRCLPEKCVELLESIKLFLDLEGYLFVIGVDKEVVEQGIRHHYRLYAQNDDQGNHNGGRIISPDEYLDKMIQMPLELPPIEPTRKIKFIEKLLGDSPYRSQAQMIEAGVEDNPRSITRFVNYLAFMGRLAETLKDDILKEEVSPGRPEEFQDLIGKCFAPSFYVKWAIIVFSFPEVYRQIKNKTQHIFDLQSAVKAKDDVRPGEETGDSASFQGFPEKLRNVLAMDEPFPEESWLIKKFIHLSASVGMAVSGKKASGSAGVSSEVELRTRGYGVETSFADMVLVKKGPFLYGEDKKSNSIDYDYEIDVYPVTNQQYKEFVDASGYTEKKYWSEDGWAWLQKEQVAEPKFWQDEKFNKDDHPVVGVSYFEAEAFAAWAGKRLPTEEEWERTARGDNGLIYPWGDEFDKEYCNTKESGIGKTTPVNRYQQGKSPYGCLDMAGNVWEWTSSNNNKDKEIKVLRGGSWLDDRGLARCAARAGSLPYDGTYDGGFRCARILS